MELESTAETASNRPGTVERELEVWLTTNPTDESLAEVSRFLTQQVREWHDGKDPMLVMHDIVGRYHQTDGLVSELASAVLHQSTMWFGYEAEIPLEEQFKIDELLAGVVE